MALPPPPSKTPGTPGGISRTTRTFAIAEPAPRGQRIIIYGAGGTGKSTLAALAERVSGPVVFIDCEGTVPVSIKKWKKDLGLSPRVVQGVRSWQDLLDVTGDDQALYEGVQTIVIDSLTEAQSWAIQHVVANVPTESGKIAESIESYGYGKGYRHLLDQMVDLRNNLNAHCGHGRNVIIIAHDVVAKVPNPEGIDFIRYEPNIYQDSGVSVRRYWRDWCDHLLFISKDVSVSKTRDEKHAKASGGVSNTITTQETATAWAKSRGSLDPEYTYDYGDSSVWNAVFNNQ